MARNSDEKFAIAAIGLWVFWVLVGLAINVGIICVIIHFVAKYW